MKIKNIILSILRGLSAAIFWIAVWCAVSYRTGSELLFPSPASVTKALFELAVTTDFWKTAAYSLLRVALGIIISLFIGSLLALLTEKIKTADTLLSPMLGVIKATPVASFIILALLWLDRNTLPLFITALIVIPIVWSNVSAGIRSVDNELIEVTRIYGFSPLKRLKRLYLPSITPYFLAACRSSLGLAWKAGISAEVLSTPKYAIGTELYFSKTYFETPSLFAWTLVVILMSIIIEKLFVLGIERGAVVLGLMPKGGSYDKT